MKAPEKDARHKNFKIKGVKIMKLKNLSSVILAAMMAAASVPASGLIVPYSNLTAYAIETEGEAAYDNGVVAEGTCGENLKWEIDSLEDILIISGYGEMTDWEKPEDAPWFEYSDEFDIVIIRPGVGELSENSLGSNAKIIYLTSYNCVIPDSETAIPADARILGYAGSTAQAYAEKYGREFKTLSEENEEHPLMEGVCTENLEWILWDDGSLSFYGYGDIVAENGVYPWDVVADSIKQVVINTAVKSIGENAFTNCTNLESVLMYTPDCQIADSADVFPSGVLLQVGDGSTAEEYAVKYNLTHNVYNFFTASGEIGDNLTWVLFSGGSLRIYGEGDMIDLGGVSPWAEYEDEITRVQINHEVTSVDEAAFEGCDNIAEMIVLNPECKFVESEDAIPEDTVIYAAKGSGALMYAQMFGRSFKTLSSEITAPEEEEESYIAYGELGENLTWELLNDGMLEIDGEGEMLECGEGGYPWSDFSDKIKDISLAKEVTSVGAYAFYNCKNLETLHLAPVVGAHAYDGCSNVTVLGFYEDLTINEIGDYAFNGCDNLGGLTIENPECVIADSEFVFPTNTVIHGYAGSTAQAHAEKYGLDFVDIAGGEQEKLPEGECGESIIWSFDESNGYLWLRGEGVMNNWESADIVPWAEYADKITNISIDGWIESIGDYAFSGLTNLRSVQTAGTADQIARIGVHAFDGCTSLKSIPFNYVTEIQDYAFYGCDSLEHLYLSSENCTVADSPNVFPEGILISGMCEDLKTYAEKYNLTFDDCNIFAEGNLDDDYTWTLLNNGSLSIDGTGDMPVLDGESPWSEYADKVTYVFFDSKSGSIGDYAFYNFKNLEGVGFAFADDCLMEIGSHAFEGCEKLKGFTVCENITEIGDYAFNGCDSLENVYIINPDCVIADSEFVFPANTVIHGYAGSTAQAYAEKYGLVFVEIESEEQEFIAYGELGENLTWELLNNGMLYINGEGEMLECGEGGYPWSDFSDKIKDISLAKEVTSIGAYAFYNCKNLETLHLAPVIGAHAYDGCSNATVLGFYVDLAINEIGDYAFNGCDGIEVVYIGNPDCVIADSEFVFPANTVIHGYAGSTAQAHAEKYNMHFTAIRKEIVSGEFGEGFEWTIFDDNTIFINGVGEMPEYEAGNYPWSEYSDMIKEIQLGKEVESIGAYAFYNCTNLNHIQLAPVIGEHAYDGCINAYGVGYYSDIPVNEIGDYAFNNCGFFSYQFTNPDCVIADSEFVFPADATLWGYEGSTAQAHAEKYGLEFISINDEKEPVTTTTTTTTTASDSETTTTTTANDSESELPQTGFSKAYDYLAFSAGVMALCGFYAMKKSKKKEDEE